MMHINNHPQSKSKVIEMQNSRPPPPPSWSPSSLGSFTTLSERTHDNNFLHEIFRRHFETVFEQIHVEREETDTAIANAILNARKRNKGGEESQLQPVKESSSFGDDGDDDGDEHISLNTQDGDYSNLQALQRSRRRGLRKEHEMEELLRRYTLRYRGEGRNTDTSVMGETNPHPYNESVFSHEDDNDYDDIKSGKILVSASIDDDDDTSIVGAAESRLTTFIREEMQDIRKINQSISITRERTGTGSSISFFGDEICDAVGDNLLDDLNDDNDDDDDDDDDNYVPADITSSTVGSSGLMTTSVEGITHRKKSEDSSFQSLQEQASWLRAPSLMESECDTAEEQYYFHDKWTSYWSDDHERVYYYNMTTHQTCWMKPRNTDIVVSHKLSGNSRLEEINVVEDIEVPPPHRNCSVANDSYAEIINETEGVKNGRMDIVSTKAMGMVTRRKSALIKRRRKDRLLKKVVLSGGIFLKAVSVYKLIEQGVHISMLDILTTNIQKMMDTDIQELIINPESFFPSSFPSYHNFNEVSRKGRKVGNESWGRWQEKKTTIVKDMSWCRLPFSCYFSQQCMLLSGNKAIFNLDELLESMME